MTYQHITPDQHERINAIVKKHLRKRDRSTHEMRYQDCERLGMDAVNKYCRTEGIPTLGTHMVNAAIALAG